MDSCAMYEYVLSRVNDELAPFGYKRSGKGTLFYRFSENKKLACAIEMQKSCFNFCESYSFTFNFLCVDINDIKDHSIDKLTVAALKSCFSNPYLSERIGILCHNKDIWWEFSHDTLKSLTLEEYYDKYIKSDLIKTAMHLDEVAKDKISY